MTQHRALLVVQGTFVLFNAGQLQRSSQALQAAMFGASIADNQ